MALITSNSADGICTLTLNRADKLNALNREMYALLTDGFNSASADSECRVIVLQGARRPLRRAVYPDERHAQLR